MFVLDPTLSKEGSWTVYSMAIGTMHELVVNGQSTKLIGGGAGLEADLGRYYVLEDPTQLDQPYDIRAAGTTHIQSHYVTPWFDAGQPALKKKWSRPEFVARSLDANSTIVIDARFDWDSQVVRRSFSLSTNVDATTFVWGDPWGEKWGGQEGNSPRSEHLSGPSLGLSRAIQMKVNGPVAENKHWGLNALVVKYTIKPPRS